MLVLNNLGIVYYYQAKYSEALRTYESALQSVEKAKNGSRGPPMWRQFTLMNLATLYQRLGNDQRAIKTYNDVLAHPEDITPRDLGHMNTNTGSALPPFGRSARMRCNITAMPMNITRKRKTLTGNWEC